jgi:outer membrane immunogenic protein
MPQPAPVQAPAVYVPTVAPVCNWGGIYVGINGGWGWGQSSWTVGPAGLITSPLTGSTSDNGGVVGGTIGANFQTGEFVFGVEAIGTIPASTQAPPLPFVPSLLRVRLATIG